MGTISPNRKKQTKRRPHPIGNSKVKGRKLNKKKVFMTAIIFILIIWSITKIITPKANTVETNLQVKDTPETINNEMPEEPTAKKEITDWNLLLVNYENVLPEDFAVDVENIDENRQFDARAIKYLTQMINDMRKDGITDIWIQSAYRSVERQKELYNNSIKKYLSQGKTQEEAETLTNDYINKPGTSEHNLGLAVDFNFVNNEFEEGKAFKWLKEHAEDYGFILRYPKEKEDITKISYESWHWRYVGEEHAKKINELNMCLEEYIEYLQNQG